MVKTELGFVYITSDSKKFLNKKDAISWEKELHINNNIHLFEDKKQQNVDKEKELRWRQTKAKQRAIDLNVKSLKK